MPVPLLKHSFCRRSHGGPKAHAHAAYLSGTKLDDGFGNTADFTPKGGILHADIWLPESAPAMLIDRGRLWRSLEARESRTTRPGDAVLAHKFIGALPCELSLEENIRYVKDFIREQFVRKGYAADWAIHGPDPGSDNRNYHVHIMVPLRKFENGQWAKKKDRFPKNSPALSHFIKGKQTAFFELQNRYLEKNGITARLVYQNGKWTVTQGGVASRMSTPNYTYAPPQPPIITNPIVRPSQSPGLGGGASCGSQALHTKYEAMKQQHHSVVSRRGWPEQAVIDWETWGIKDPIRFFRLWSELLSGNPAPGGGP